MSNLSELIPAGGGQNNTDFVATGTLSSGQAVVLKTDGTVEAIGNAAPTLGAASATIVNSPARIASTYDTANDKVVLFYTTGGIGLVAVGTISGTTITFGTGVNFNGTSQSDFMGASFDVNAGKVLVTYKNASNSNYGTASVGTVSGTSISFGTATVFDSVSTAKTSCCYDSTSQKNIIAYTLNGSGYYSKAVVGTISGTGISFGSVVTVEASDNYEYIVCVYDPDQNKTVVVVTSNTNSNTTCYVGTVSGTSISFGSGVTLQSFPATGLSATYDTTANKIVFCYQKASSCGAKVGTVSGTSISFGTETEFNSSFSYYISASYMPSTNTTVVAFVDNSNSEIATYRIGTVSGTGISFGSKVTYNTTNNQSITTVSAPDFNAVMMTSRTYSSPYPLVANVYSAASNLTATNLLGITSAAIADTETGTINTWGSRNEVQTSLTIGSDYYVQTDGTITTSSSGQLIGQAITATQINIKDYTG
jgi:hypothetical protein